MQITHQKVKTCAKDEQNLVFIAFTPLGVLRGLPCVQTGARECRVVRVSGADEVCVDSLSTTSSESSFVRTPPSPTPTVCHHRAVPSTCWLNFNHAPHPPTTRPPDHLYCSRCESLQANCTGSHATSTSTDSLLFDSNIDEQMVWLFPSIDSCAPLFSGN